MATVDVVVPSRSGIHEEAKGPLTVMLQKSNCFCRDERGLPKHQPWACTRNKHSVRMMPPIYGSSVVHWARNQAIAQAMYYKTEGDPRPETEYFLLMDDDMVPEAEYLTRLLSYKLPIVCGICTIRRDPPRPNIRYWNEAECKFYDPVKWDWDSQKLMEIDGAGAAFMLVKREVFEKMGLAYLDCVFEIAEYERMGALTPEAQDKFAALSVMRHKMFEQSRASGDWKNMDQWWFCFLDNIVSGQIGELGEDLSFCYKAKKLGYKIYADPQVLPGHLGLYAYSIRDWREHVDAAIRNGELKSLPQNEVALAISG